MLTFAALRDLERRLQNRKVLSVFVDTSAIQPPRRFGWREQLNRALARLEVTVPSCSSGERTARELCMAHLRTLLEGMRALPEGPGWVAYVTTDDVIASGAVRASLETSAFWQNGIVVAPLLSTVAAPRAIPFADVVSAAPEEWLRKDSGAVRLALPRRVAVPAIASGAHLSASRRAP
jgi:hypothetical protein